MNNTCYDNDTCDQCLHKEVYRLDLCSFGAAAKLGRLDIVKHMCKHEGCHSEVLEEVVEYGHLDIVKYIYENFEQDPDSIKRAIVLAKECGHLDIVEYLKEKTKTKRVWSCKSCGCK